MNTLAVPARSSLSGRGTSPRGLATRARGGAFLLVLALTVACAGTSPDRIAYNTIDGAVDAVQTALGVFNVAYQSGVQTDPTMWNDRRVKAKAAYEKFQVTARSATKLSQEALDPQHQTSAVKLASDAAVEALGIIQAFTGGK